MQFSMQPAAVITAYPLCQDSNAYILHGLLEPMRRRFNQMADHAPHNYRTIF